MELETTQALKDFSYSLLTDKLAVYELERANTELEKYLRKSKRR